MSDSGQEQDEDSIPAKKKRLTVTETPLSSPSNSREHSGIASLSNQNCNNIAHDHSNYFVGCNIGTLTIIEDSTAKGIPADSSEINEILNVLQAKLCNRAKALYSTNLLKHPLNGQTVNAVPLELTREVFRTQNTFSPESSVSPKKTNPNDTLSYKNLFAEAAKLSESQTMAWNNTVEKENHKRIHGNIVGVIGLPGIGKTTWTTFIAKRCMEKHLYKTEFLFYIKFQDISFERDTTLLRLLLISSAFSPTWKDFNMDNAVLDILDKMANILIIMDGLNEANYTKLSEPSSLVSLHGSAKPDELIKNLLCGNILPNSKKILTSRPRQMYELHLDYRPQFIVHARGISKTSQKKICEDICRNSHCSHMQVFKCISDNYGILSYCENPLNCILVFECLKQQLLKKENDIVDVAGSRTELFLLVLEMFLHCNQSPGNFTSKCEKLYNLAWTAISMQRSYFTESEMLEAEVTKDLMNALFNIHADAPPGQKLVGGSIKYSFAHLILAEFLAAVKLIRTKNVTEFSKNIFLLGESRFETVGMFLFGLCHHKTLERLTNLGISTDFSQNDTRLRELKNFTVKTLKASLESKRRDSLDVLLRICSCVYEMRDDEFASEVAHVLGNKLTVIGNIFRSDIAGFCYVLKAKRSRAFELCLGPSLKFIGNSFCLFFERIYTIVHESYIVMRSVDVSRNSIGNHEAKALSKCLPYIGSLNVSDCKLNKSQVKIITDQISRLNFLYEVYFSYNDLKDDASTCIADCLNKIDRLHVSMCGFSEAGISTLSNAIASRSLPLEHFCCSGNITDAKLFLISQCVGKIDELFIGLRNEKVNVVVGIEQLCSAIEGLTQPMQSLTILGSNIGDEGLMAISKCLKNINKLRLGHGYDENLTSWGIRQLSAAFSKLQAPIKKFVFCCPNKFLDEIVVEFSFCKNNIEHLEIR